VSKDKKLFWVVAAGTGGHIFPGLRIAESLEKKDSHLEFCFFGSRQRLESEIIPKYGRRIRFLKASPWKGKGILSRLLALLDVVVGFFQVFFFSFKEAPVALLSVGGYVSLPVALAAFVRRKKIFIVEPNIRAGVSNRIVSKMARLAFSTPGSDAAKRFGCPVKEFGNPVRAGFKPCEIRAQVSRILVLGGSQGAKAVCESAIRAAVKLRLDQNGIRVLLQSGAANLDFSQKLKESLKLGPSFEIRAFVERVDEELQAADLVIARAGAMTVAELSIAALPTIFVPFPFAADDHQRVNAKLLEDAGAAKCIDERDPQFQSNLEMEISRLMENFELRRSRSSRLAEWGRPAATEAISAAILAELTP
jgi:UDP-N-acetylglucosamine--N-acetylmuramyl-(pentapeptide) pyrophosphoryl-undecaprenol N-acetylglucosamine transferase